MSEHALRRPIALLGLTQLAIGCWMMFATESFGDTVASFDGFNRHDLRDFDTLYLALGRVFLVSAARPAWRFPCWGSRHSRTPSTRSTTQSTSAAPIAAGLDPSSSSRYCSPPRFRLARPGRRGATDTGVSLRR
jgi:hypothetical protein